MTLFRKSFIALSIAAMPFTADVMAQNAVENGFVFAKASAQANTILQQPLRAADADLMTLGWCMDAWGQTMQVQRDATDTYAHQVHVAAYFPKEVISKYKGDQVKYIDFAVEPKHGSMVTVFVTNDLKSETYLGSGTTTNWEEGWNRCELSNPYTITGTEGVYVGYMVWIGENESMNTCTYDNNLVGIDGHNYYGADGSWNKLPVDQVPGNFRVRAIIEGDNKPNCDVSIEKLYSSDDYIEQNKGSWNPSLAIRNYGKEHVTSLQVEAWVNGKMVSTINTADDPDNDFEIREGELSTINLKGLTFPDQGTSNVTLKITKVNGKDDPDMSDNSIDHTIFCYAEDAKRYQHNVLVEQFTAEYYDQSPAADALYSNVLDSREDVVWVKHHTKYKGVQDKYTAEGETAYEALYGKSDRFVPAICSDRRIFVGANEPGPAYFIDNTDDMIGIVEGAKSVPAFVKLGVDVKKSADGQTLNAVVNGESSTAELQEQTDVRLTVWLVEDDITSTTQKGMTTYIQNGVLRKIVSETWGDQIDLSTLAFSRSYEIPVSADWNVDNTRVVAFLSNYNATDITKCQVYQATQTKVNPNTAINDIDASEAPMVVYRDGKVDVVGTGYYVESVCDVAGREVSINNLTSGLYIVNVSNGKTSFAQKLYVK